MAQQKIYWIKTLFHQSGFHFQHNDDFAGCFAFFVYFVLFMDISKCSTKLIRCEVIAGVGP